MKTTIYLFQRKIVIVLCLLVLGTWNLVAGGPLPYSKNPNWVSNPGGNYSTGMAFADINGDGWLDIVVSNGNDMAPQRLVVYSNKKDGTFPITPDWQSDDLDYNGTLSVGDIDNDGDLDVAVSMLLGRDRTYMGGGVKLYMNNNGTLEKTPSWLIRGFSSFGVALGDANGDGYLDLAVSAGNPYYGPVYYLPSGANKINVGRYKSPMFPPFKKRCTIYFNTKKGKLNAYPGWRTDRELVSFDVEFADINQDNLIDIAFAGGKQSVYFGQVYNSINLSGVPDGEIIINPANPWTASVCNYYGFSIDVVETLDINKKDFSLLNSMNGKKWVPALVVSNNESAGGGDGRINLFLFNSYSSVTYNPKSDQPFWVSRYGGTGAGVALADVNDDGFVDMITGQWTLPGNNELSAPIKIYQGDGTAFSQDPSFQASATSVMETITVADVRNRGYKTKTESFANITGCIVTLVHPYVARVNTIQVNGQDVMPAAKRQKGSIWYVRIPGEQVIYFSEKLDNSNVTVTYDYSVSLDIGVANWNAEVGNFIYYNMDPN